MQKIIILIISCFLFTGCSLIPKVNFNTDGTTPQSINKSKFKGVCKGQAKFNEVGEMISCSKGYYLYQEGYSKKERKYTIKEKIINFFRNLSGYAFWIVTPFTA